MSIEIVVSSLTHDIEWFLIKNPHIAIIGLRGIEGTQNFPKSNEITIIVPTEKECETVATLYEFELEKPLCNKGCEKPARWLKFPKGSSCFCLSNVFAIDDDSDLNHTRFLVSY